MHLRLCILLHYTVTIFFLIFHQLHRQSHFVRKYTVSIWGLWVWKVFLFRGCYIRMLHGQRVPWAFVRGYQQVAVTFQLLLVFHL